MRSPQPYCYQTFWFLTIWTVENDIWEDFFFGDEKKKFVVNITCSCPFCPSLLQGDELSILARCRKQAWICRREREDDIAGRVLYQAGGAGSSASVILNWYRCRSWYILRDTSASLFWLLLLVLLCLFVLRSLQLPNCFCFSGKIRTKVKTEPRRGESIEDLRKEMWIVPLSKWR